MAVRSDECDFLKGQASNIDVNCDLPFGTMLFSRGRDGRAVKSDKRDRLIGMQPRWLGALAWVAGNRSARRPMLPRWRHLQSPRKPSSRGPSWSLTRIAVTANEWDAQQSRDGPRRSQPRRTEDFLCISDHALKLLELHQGAHTSLPATCSARRVLLESCCSLEQVDWRGLARALGMWRNRGRGASGNLTTLSGRSQTRLGRFLGASPGATTRDRDSMSHVPSFPPTTNQRPFEIPATATSQPRPLFMESALAKGTLG
jgi:hypothetical protein